MDRQVTAEIAARRRRWGAALLALAPVAAAAQTAPAPAPIAPELARFIEQPAQREAVLALVNDQAARLPGECKALTFTTDHIAVSIVPRFNASGVPLHGQWKESWTATGCGKTKIFNVEIFTRDNGAVSRLLLMPGTTRAAPGLQSDAMLHAVTAATAGGCQDRTVVDTAFLAFDGPPLQGAAPGREARPWHEEWTVNSCGAVAVVTLHFTPDSSPSGIRVTADARPAK